jgi:hypothetical protein
MSNESTEARALLEQAGPKTIHDNSYASACVSKWSDLLEGIPVQHDNGYTKKATAILLENEMEHIKSFHEDTLSTNAGSFTKYIFPILRRVFPNLIANQLVSVQPMTAPVGGVFYYEKKYDDRKGTTIPQAGISDDPTDTDYDGELQADDNINQNFAKYYSSEFIDYDVACTDTGTGTATLNQGATNCRTTEWKPIRDNGTAGQRTFYVKAYYRIKDADDSDAALEVCATMNDSGNLIDDTDNTNTVGTFTIASGNWTITPAGSAGTASDFWDNTVVYFQYFVNWELVGYTTGAEIPSISLDISLQTVQAESRKLKARWTVEAVDDLRALHGMDAEAELVSTFSNEVMLEVDREIITDLVNAAAHSATYTYAATTPGEIETIRLLLTQISAVSAAIHRTSGRAPANFLVVPPGIGALLDQLSSHGDYASIEQNVQSPSYGPVTANYGIARIGTLLRKYAVYQDPYMDSDKILVGLKGNSFIDAGYVYAPYVPLQVTPTFLDPNDFTFRKGVRTRYATKMLRPEYYGVVTCSSLPSVTTTL